MKHTECIECELSHGDCGYHFKADGKTNYDIASLSACDQYGNCMFFKSKAEPKGDLISRSELIKALEPYKFSICGFEGVLALIDNAPTIHHPNCDTCEGLAKQYSMGFQDGFLTGKERPQGEWLKDEEHSITIEMFKCSICGYWNGADHFRFCPNCGAKMKHD